MGEEIAKELSEELSKVIERKNLERELGDIFYKICPNVPATILALTVRQTIDNFKILDDLYKSEK